MTKPKVSIIVPVYNAENYISNTLDSILNQSLEEIEILVINDGSKDNSKKILDDYSNKYKKIEVFHQTNSGVSVSRNKGISIAKGEYIGFVDSDDIIDKDMYKIMYEKAQECNADIVICGFLEEDLNKNILRKFDYKFANTVLQDNKINSTYKNSLDTNLEPLGCPAIWNKIFKTKLVKDNNLYINENITVGEDFCFNIKCFCKAKVIAGVDRNLYHYMSINPDSIMSKANDKKFINFINGRNTILNTLDSHNLHSDNYFKYEYSRNFANFIQIADYRVRNTRGLNNKYKELATILELEDFKNTCNLLDSKYLSKNLHLIKILSIYNLNILVFVILYIRTLKK